jgi:hypothetical protein
MDRPTRECQLVENDTVSPDRGAPSREEPWLWYLRRRARGLYRRIRTHFAPGATTCAGAPSSPSPRPALDLRAGDMVRVRSRGEIYATLDAAGTLHGCAIVPNMYAFCGRELRVLKRMDRFFDERRWRMLRCHEVVLLEGATCDASFDGDFRGCDRTCFLFWRAEWLQRIR